MRPSNKRYEFVDLAKGFCILFVMSIHITDQTFFSFPWISSFRMPFYFFICGLFLKTNDSIDLFVKKKINALIIPFLTFETLGVIWQGIGHSFNDELYPNYLTQLINPWHCVNGPLWFLLCLFWAYLVFMLLAKSTFGKNIYYLSIPILLLSIGSFYLSRLTFHGHLLVMPLFFSSSLTALVFIYAGALLKQSMHILDKWKYDYLVLLGSLTVFVLTQFYLGASTISFEWNQFGQSYLQTVLAGITGSLSILYICKFIEKIPILSYIGRYSIIALGIHGLLLVPIWSLHLNPYLSILLIVALVIPCIYLFVRFLPKLCAQAPCIRISNKQ